MFRNKFIRICITLLLVLSLFTYAFADDEEENNNSRQSMVERVYNDTYTDVYVTPIIRNDIEGELVDVRSIVNTVTPNDANGLKAILLTLIGDYETVVTDYTYQNSSNYYSHSIQIERDWAWLASCTIFAIVIWCTFRGVVSILCKM